MKKKKLIYGSIIGAMVASVFASWYAYRSLTKSVKDINFELDELEW